jgi:hypothetical protein
MGARVTTGFVKLFIDLFSILEPLAPPFMSLYIGRRLNRWRDADLISGYSSGIKRVGRYHYVITVDLKLTQKQTDGLLTRILSQAFKRR